MVTTKDCLTSLYLLGTSQFCRSVGLKFLSYCKKTKTKQKHVKGNKIIQQYCYFFSHLTFKAVTMKTSHE